MNGKTLTAGRNQSMECWKIVGAFIVVFDHFPLPGRLGAVLVCLCQYVVPMFLAISGYFNYQARPDQIRRRLLHIAKLNIFADLFHLICTCIWTEYQQGSTIAYLRAAVPDPDELLLWLFIQKNSFLGHLWYLISIGIVYLLFWGYSSFYDQGKVNYRPWYTMAAALFGCYFAFGIIMPITGAGGILDTRNAWFTGIPMFSLGLFIREYQDRLFQKYRLTSQKLALLAGGGIALSLMQLELLGVSGITFGMPIGLLGLMLLLVANPSPGLLAGKSARKIVSHLGNISTGIYLFHLTVGIMYDCFLHDTTRVLFGERDVWLTPLVILAISVLVAVLWDAGCCLLKKKHSASRT